MPELATTAGEESVDSRLNRLEELASLAKQLRDSDPPKSQLYCEEALKLIGRESSLKLIKADILLSYSVALYRTGNYTLGLNAAEQAKMLFESLNDSSSLARCLSAIGNIYHDLTDYASAIKYHQESLNLFTQIEDKEGISNALNNLGIVFSSTHDFPQSIAFFEKCLSLRRQLGNSKMLAMAEMNLANAYSQSGKTLIALQHYENALTIFREEKNQYGMSLTLANIANEYFALRSFGKARSYLRQSQLLCEEVNNLHTLAFCHKTFGEISLAESLWQDAELYLLKAKDLYTELHSLKEQSEVLTLLSNLYAKQQKFEQAFSALSLASQLKEKFLNEEKQRQISALHIRYESERFQRESEIYRQRSVELEDANRSLREANQFKLDLIALVSHDLKNPLQTIIGFSDLIKEVVFLPDDSTTSLDVLRDRLKEGYLMTETISRSADFMLSLIKDLLDSAAIESHKLKLDLNLYPLSELLEHAVFEYAPVASLKQQEIISDIAPNCLAFIDAARIRQVFHNLIDNAIKYSPFGKRIYVSLKRLDSTTAEIRIRDEGQGFSEEDLKKAFGRFQKLSSIPTGKERSTGLGLALCKQLVELHRGSIRIESACKNQGATIVVQLLLADDSDLRTS